MIGNPGSSYFPLVLYFRAGESTKASCHTALPVFDTAFHFIEKDGLVFLSITLAYLFFSRLKSGPLRFIPSLIYPRTMAILVMYKIITR